MPQANEKKQDPSAPPRDAARPDPAVEPVTRGQFFLHLMTGLSIHFGFQAFSSDMLESIKNNADNFYETYCQIVRRTYETATERERAEREIKKRVEAEARLADAEDQITRLRRELGVEQPKQHALAADA